MCFVKVRKEDKPKIAQKDIVCYKVGCINYTNNTHTSVYMDFVYEINKLYKIKHWRTKDVKEIEIGFHSMAKKPLCRYGIVKCIIPKGSKYYRSKGLYVSNQIIVTEKEYQFNFYIYEY